MYVAWLKHWAVFMLYIFYIYTHTHTYGWMGDANRILTSQIKAGSSLVSYHRHMQVTREKGGSQRDWWCNYQPSAWLTLGRDEGKALTGFHPDTQTSTFYSHHNILLLYYAV